MIRVNRYCGCMRTDCCLRTDGWCSYDWVPVEWARDEQRVEDEKAKSKQ
jgi:hypothetical protein